MRRLMTRLFPETRHASKAVRAFPLVSACRRPDGHKRRAAQRSTKLAAWPTAEIAIRPNLPLDVLLAHAAAPAKLWAMLH